MRQIEGRKLADFLGVGIGGHLLSRLKEVVHLGPVVGEQEGAAGGHVENPLVDRAFHLPAGHVEIHVA